MYKNDSEKHFFSAPYIPKNLPDLSTPRFSPKEIEKINAIIKGIASEVESDTEIGAKGKVVLVGLYAISY